LSIERRSFASALRFDAGAASTSTIGTLRGYAAVFNVLSQEMGPGGKRFREKLMPGAFRSTLLAGQDVLAFYHHGLAGGMMGATMPLGSTRSGSLRLSEDARGLLFSLTLPATTQARDVAALVRAGIVQGASFAFDHAKDAWSRGDSGLIRTVHEIVGLIDVSVTHSPAYQQTTIGMSGSDGPADGDSRRRHLYLIDLEQDLDRRRHLEAIDESFANDRRRFLERMERSRNSTNPFGGDAA
jgi:HK97 family phage prohead protease